uniref:Flp family type IVb pilin n=1 Tax=uncultured Erythrobacter sp. TaxID=263913 RepID=UPI0026046A5D|nr:Flp family type IVb pilin [uncultured Erythrobacter sp.]
MQYANLARKKFNEFASDETGATAIEYALIASLISIAAITAMASLGSQLSDTFSSTNEILANS